MRRDDLIDDNSHATMIQASWQRCEHFGLHHHSTPQLERLPQEDYRNLQWMYGDLVNTTATEVLPFYENILSNSKCMVMLADAQGQVLQSWGDTRFITPVQKPFFAAGVSWQERTNGTNAIGTVLASGQPVQVLRDEHYLKANRFMIGSAAPIFDANRDLLGVLDVSSDAYLPQAHTLGMVRLMSQSVENRLIFKKYADEHFLVTFNTNIDTLDSQWSGLLVVNEDGMIISANRRAELLLSVELSMINIGDVFDTRFFDMKHQPDNLPMRLRTQHGYQMQALIRKPTQTIVEPVDYRNKPAKNTPPPLSLTVSLNRISFGDARADKCVQQASRLIEKDIPILIHGETGVGKEVFVKALHEFSSRKAHSLVAVNCAAIPSELVESELFGYVKGAFTGANQKGAIGLIRKAHKGTLFLDEIGEMPTKAQARLLRVLQERKVTPLGSTESFPIDIRLISATNRSLRDEVHQGNFRQDLYYRVSGLNLELPPLRERTDKRQLFQEIYQMEAGVEQTYPLSEHLLALFEQHPWPGNIRQLVSVIQIALAMADHDPVDTSHLPDDFFSDLERSPLMACQTLQTASNQAHNNEPQTKKHIPQKATISSQPQVISDDIQAQTLALFDYYEGNVSQTAKALNISRNTLYKRLREAGIR